MDNIKRLQEELDAILEADIPAFMNEPKAVSRKELMGNLRKEIENISTAVTSLGNQNIEIIDPINAIKRSIEHMINTINNFKG